MATVQLLTGTLRSDRSEAIDDRLLEHWGRALLIVPTRRFARRRTAALLDRGGLPGVLGRRVQTFQEFASSLIGGGTRNHRLVTRLDQRVLLEQGIDAANRDGALGPVEAIADTEGFISHIEWVIAQLKQAAIEPEEFRERVAQRPRRHELDGVVAAIYGAYQGALVEAKALDLQGMYWVADQECQAKAPAALENIETLLLDGFDDFTRSEFRLLRSVERHVNEMVFGLNHDIGAMQQDLYRITANTVGDIRDAFNPTIHDCVECEPDTYTAFTSRSLFWRDEPKRPNDLRADMTLLECYDPVHEAETIARRIKRLVREQGTPLSEVAVVYRRLGDTAGILRDVFHECGIPLGITGERSLDESSCAAFLVRFFDAIDTWGRELVLDVITSAWYGELHPESVRHRETFPLLARTARIVSGKRHWLDRSGRLLQRLRENAGQDTARLMRHVPQAEAACEALLAGLNALDDAAGHFPPRAPITTFAWALDDLIDRLAAPENVMAGTDAALRAVEERAVTALRHALARLHDRYAGDDRPVPRATFVARLKQALQLTTVSEDAPSSAVTVLDFEAARHLQFDHVFAAGLTESVTPGPPRRNAIYSDRDADELRDLGVPLDDPSLHNCREMLLFHRLLSVARTQLTLSWHVATLSGQETRPSPYIEDLRGLLPEIETQRARSTHEMVVPRAVDAACMRDVRAIVMHEAIDPGEMSEPVLRTVVAGAATERQRYDNGAFDAYDGVIGNEHLIEVIRSRYAEDHAFSVSQLETYASCPFRFFVERILRIHSEDDPDETFDPRVRGEIVHRTLEAFHRRYAGTPIAEIPPEEAREAMRSLLDETFRARSWQSTNATEGITGVELRRIGAALERYLHIEAGRGETEWRPAYFEAAFGGPPGADGEEPTKAGPFVFDTEAGPVLFSGRIDRIDTSEAGVRLIDYKSSASAVEPREIKSGRSFQLSVYSLAAQEHLLPDRPCLTAYYVPVGRKKRIAGITRDGDKPNWDERIGIARESVARCVTGIREGRFYPPLEDRTCRYCPAEKVCRHERARMVRKAEG